MRYALLVENKENKWEVVAWESTKKAADAKAKQLLENGKPTPPHEVLILSHITTHRIVVDVRLEEYDHTKEVS